MGKIQIYGGTVIFGDLTRLRIGYAINVLSKYLEYISHSIKVTCVTYLIQKWEGNLFFNLKDVQIEILTIATDFFALTNDFLQMNGHFDK